MVMGGADKVVHPVSKPARVLIPQAGVDIRSELGLSGVSGWMVVDIDTGEVLDSASADQPFVPASVAKLPTAAFALDAMGPKHRFETRLLATGPVRGGQVQGDLILSGGGDPELDTDGLAAMSAALVSRGVKGTTGRFVVDGSALVQVPEIDHSQADDASYNPSVSGLNLNFNRVHVKWDARNGRDQLSVEAVSESMSPRVQGVQVAVASFPGGPLFSLLQSGEREVWEMSQKAYRGRGARWLPVKGPERYAGEVFRDLATSQGVRLGPIEAGSAPRGAEVLATQRSRQLGSILRDMLRYSTNLTAEVTGVAATRATGSDVETLGASAEVMNAWAASVAGFPLGDPGFRFVNHSGLTLDSKVSPRRMVDLLRALARRAADPGRQHGRLPGGIAGYLKPHNVVAESFPLNYDELDVVAKTGTINFVRGLAGYIATPGGRRMAFAIFSNDLPRRASGPQRVNKRWMGRAKGFERALIRNWVLKADQG
jgi:D-alanyl-D-alanine carboxypeptidase/D-alanyl-D-alanine-endopeptidase (penicillin-binding protein 4)